MVSLNVIFYNHYIKLFFVNCKMPDKSLPHKGVATAYCKVKKSITVTILMTCMVFIS